MCAYLSLVGCVCDRETERCFSNMFLYSTLFTRIDCLYKNAFDFYVCNKLFSWNFDFEYDNLLNFSSRFLKNYPCQHTYIITSVFGKRWQALTASIMAPLLSLRLRIPKTLPQIVGCPRRMNLKYRTNMRMYKQNYLNFFWAFVY